ncbi:MAG: L-threo-3-hydroxyaspartate ammonia-lyase [uncultured Rubrobacteraceae bacterium]|uniref:threonine ammonia-lyase n=1 Tax=uncultured Rubrobacteraceae bacterium TaxID=349277 RepID=A0A6J4R3Z5_9ACTN|nr:MAG: L-threo-3-hydroxyaspartate ammonia-lyase [uncultured Rubrobacteraceae bacterium]
MTTARPSNNATRADPPPVVYANVEAAAARLEGVANRTPVLTSRMVDERVGGKIFFKCENFQRMGAFKFRGAYNAMSRLSEEQKRAGVLAYSSGNHAQAVALAGRLLDVRTTIVMPGDAPSVKLDATRGYGAEVVEYDRAETTREELGGKLAGERGLSVIPPYDHPDVIAGQGTAAKELFEDVGVLDLLLVCCGGGGLLSGCAISARTLSSECRVVGVEPEKADDATRSFRTGTLQKIENPDTIADGVRTPSLGEYTFPLVLRHVDDMVTVSEEAILRSMFFMWERMKIVVEPTGALAAAALFEGAVAVEPSVRIGVIVSGGNVDLKRATGLFA